MADTKLVVVNGDGGSAHIDMRSEASNGEGRQVIVVGDPSINANVAAVASQDVGANDQTTPAVLVRLAGSASINFAGSSTTGAIYIAGTAGTMAVNVGKVDGTVTVRLDPGYELGSVKGINSSIQVHILSTNGTMAVNVGTIAGSAAVYFSPSKPIVLADAQHTAGIFTTSGSFNGVSDLGLTLVSPSASYNFKVFALALTTTAQVHVTSRFTNGAGSATEFWRYGLQAPTAGIAGANLAVPPPSYLFATGVNTTLALHLNTASLVHYSVSYIKESA